jgi:hypothetical protein
VAEGLEDLSEDTFDYKPEEVQEDIKINGYRPYVRIQEVVLDEIKEKVLISLHDISVLSEHGMTIYLKAGRWRFADHDPFTRYMSGFEKYLPKPDLQKWNEMFPKAKGGRFEKDCSMIFGRWVCDQRETDQLRKQLGWDEIKIDPKQQLVISDTEIAGWHSNPFDVTSLKRRGNWITVDIAYWLPGFEKYDPNYKGSRGKMLFWCDGRRLMDGGKSYLPPDGRVYLRVADDADPRWEIGEEWAALLPRPDLTMPLELDAPAMYGVWEFDKSATAELLKQLGEVEALEYILSSSPSIWFSPQSMEALTQGYTISATKVRACERRGDWVLMLLGGQDSGAHSMYWCDGKRLVDLEVKRVFRRVADNSRKGITMAELIRKKK